MSDEAIAAVGGRKRLLAEIMVEVAEGKSEFVFIG